MNSVIALSNGPREISTLGWVALIVIVIFVILLNYSLFAALKRKGRSEFQVLHKLGDAIRNPNKTENEMLSELSERVSRLKEQDTDAVSDEKAG